MNNIIFIFSHQDDEFGLFNVIEKFAKKRKNVFIIYLTSGLKTKNISNKNKNLRRDNESIKTLLRLGINKNNIFFLGKKLNIPVYSLHRNLKNVHDEICKFLNKYKGQHVIFTHSWEGGNEDHDSSFVIVKKILYKNTKVFKAFEFSQYNNYKTKILPFRIQNFIYDKKKIYRNKIKFYDKLKYIKLLFNYVSQSYIWLPIFPFILVRIIMNDYGNLKLINKNLIIKKPHKGILLYEKLREKKYTNFRKYFLRFLLN
tara:strand:+ start:3420 stop:4190 length:771 start_codon:yes stop_codon:yes gene_type:complete